MQVLLGQKEKDKGVVSVPGDVRRKHMAIFGKSGTGKTTLLRNMITADLVAGNGPTVVDPHGSLVEDLLDCMPSVVRRSKLYFRRTVLPRLRKQRQPPGSKARFESPFRFHQQSRFLPSLRSPSRTRSTAGRGGEHHKYVQHLIKRWAENRGYQMNVKKSILDGLGSVDVALQKEDISIGCEISVSTSPEHELGNVQKCLVAGFGQVIFISVDKTMLAKTKAAVAKA